MNGFIGYRTKNILLFKLFLFFMIGGFHYCFVSRLLHMQFDLQSF